MFRFTMFCTRSRTIVTISRALIQARLPHTTSPDALLTDAARTIRDHKLYGLCVVNEGGDLVGILTIKDLIEALFYLSEQVTTAGPPS